MENLKEVSVQELLDSQLQFFVPSYQRGYRWTPWQVGQLVDDIDRFWNMHKGDERAWYCMQPLAVRECEGHYNVADGQQRLTTILILLEAIRQAQDTHTNYYTILYETRQSSTGWLAELADEKQRAEMKCRSSDAYHIACAYETARQMLAGKDIAAFRQALSERVKFIWYEPQGKDEEDVFNDLNAGKISLNNAELLKALLLRADNFDIDEEKGKADPARKAIALEWDNIERWLQGPLYAFVHDNAAKHYDAHIEYVLDLLAGADNKQNDEDEFFTFRYFYDKYVEAEDKGKWVQTTWNDIKNFCDMLHEWFASRTQYHYIGFLIMQGVSVIDIKGLIEGKSKSQVLELLKDKVKKMMNAIVPVRLMKDRDDDKMRRLLLLFNIQLCENACVRFDFDAFARVGRELGWQPEHVDSNTEFAAVKDKKHRDALIKAVLAYAANDEQRDKLAKAACGNDEQLNEAAKLASDIMQKGIPPEERLNDDEKQQLWNFVLLNAYTNQSYGNDLFPDKRKRILLDKDKIYMPSGTRQVFEKAYTERPNYMLAWTKTDAKAYLKTITETLKQFIPQ